MEILMPQLGETVNEGTVSAWYKQVGDSVRKDEVLADIETEKTAVELPATQSGVIAAICVEEGETVTVGTVLAVLDTGDDDQDGPLEKPTASAEPADGDMVRSAVPCQDTQTGNFITGDKNSPRLSPAVRRLLKQHDLSIESIEGTGTGGRVTKQDVLRKISENETSMQAKKSDAGVERIPFDRIRTLTARHMVQSKATSPHVLQAIEVDYSKVAQVRENIGAAWQTEKGYKLTYLPFIARAVVIALADFPRVNASVQDDALLVFEEVNLAIAIDLDFAGLVAPVIQNCTSLTGAELADGIRDFSQRARGGKLSPDELQGGTYTLSNSGKFGTLITAPIINQPQVAILSTDGISKKPIVVEGERGDAVEIRPVGVLAQSFDHRAFDGAYSAAFLQRVKEVILWHDWSEEFQLR